MGQKNQKQKHNQQFYINCAAAGVGGSLAGFGFKQCKKALVTVSYNLSLSADVLSIGVGAVLLAWGTYKIFNQPFDSQTVLANTDIQEKKPCKKKQKSLKKKMQD